MTAPTPNDSLSRRDFVRRTAGWTALFCATSAGVSCSGPAAESADASPIDLAPQFGEIKKLGRLPFREAFLGDDFNRPHRALFAHQAFLASLPGGKLPEPSEQAKVVVVGGGLAGLASAWLLRDQRPLVFEQALRFGGNAKGERWRDSTYALGAAYFIKPDEGEALEKLYAEVGAMVGARQLEAHDPVELRGKLYREFFAAEHAPEHAAAFRTYAEKLKAHEEDYPEIPIPAAAAVGSKERELVRSLDKRSLADVVIEWLDGNVPASLQAALQNYCWSSLGAGWREVSAAAGINFLAGEAFGVMVHPGGNGAIAKALHDKLRAALPAGHLRTGVVVCGVSADAAGARVSYLRDDGSVHTVATKAVVMACPKFVCKHVVQGLEPARLQAIAKLQYRAYLVVNVLLEGGLDHDFYDLYLLRDGALVESEIGAGQPPGRVTDVILGNWAKAGAGGAKPSQSVLTLYWPLPFPTGRAEVLFRPDAFAYLQPLVEQQLLDILPVLGVDAARVVEVRMARWGHALPVASPGFIADGHAEVVRQPHQGRVFFAHQDNWALPAIETSLLEAIHFAPQVAAAVA